MKPLFGLAFLILFVGSSAGCLKPKTKPPTPPQNEYKAQDSPENVLNNLQVSYRRKEIEEYSKLLRTDFIFVFQPGDEPIGFEDGFWTREADTTSTDGLFSSDDVSDVTIDLTFGAAAPATELNFPPGTMKIRVNPTFLEVDVISTNTTLQVDGDIQDMFFLPGVEANGEDPALWYLIEWRDIKGGGAAPKRFQPQSDGTPGLEPVSWSELRGRNPGR